MSARPTGRRPRRDDGAHPRSEHGLDAVHNRAGANMAGGVATALLEQSAGRIGLFEVDEAWLREVVADLSPHTVLLGNLFRDQLDRYGELEVLADEWSALVAAREGDTAFILNADDPLVADLGRDAAGEPRRRITYFGLEDRAHALERVEHASDAKHCRRCGTAYRYSAAYLGHLGDYALPELRQHAPAAAGRRHATSSCSACRARASRSAIPARRRARHAAPSRPLQRLQRDSRRRLRACSSVRASTRCAAASSRSRPPSAAPSRSLSATAASRSCS